MDEDKNKYPEGHFVGMWIGIGIAIFSAMGIPIGIALKNPGLFGIGPAIGVAFGAGIGSAIEAKKKQEGLIRPLTNKEKKNRRNLLFAGLAVFFVGLALLLFFLLR